MASGPELDKVGGGLTCHWLLANSIESKVCPEEFKNRMDIYTPRCMESLHSRQISQNSDLPPLEQRRSAASQDSL